jgi:Mg/Co/Ni transporter MgtE
MHDSMRNSMLDSMHNSMLNSMLNSMHNNMHTSTLNSMHNNMHKQHAQHHAQDHAQLHRRPKWSRVRAPEDQSGRGPERWTIEAVEDRSG